MLTQDQQKFLDRYVISLGPALEHNALDKLKGQERADKVKWVVDTIRKADQRWRKVISGTDGKTGAKDVLQEKDARDRLVNYGWMDRDAKAFEGMVTEARPFMRVDDLGDCERIIKTLKRQAEDGRNAMKKAVRASLQTALNTTWPALAKAADNKDLPRKEMLHKIEEIESQMNMMRLTLKVCGLDPALVNTFAETTKTLRDSYDKRLPTYDAGPPVDVPFVKDKVPALTYSDKVCLAIYDMARRDWFKLKKMYKSKGFVDEVAKKLDARPKDGDEVMWQLWAFRKKVVDGLIEEATKKFDLAPKGKGWVAVGSTNLESDYDLSVMQHGDAKGADDFVIVDWFNKQFQARYGTQPGIMFDTNLYASAPPRARMSDDPKTPSEKAMAAMAQSGQDVGALMKQRRFMSWEEYEDMMNDVLDEMEAAKTAPDLVKATRTQFEEADARYQQSQLRIASKSLDVMMKMEANASNKAKDLKGPEQEAALKEVQRVQDIMKTLSAILEKAEKASGSAQSQLLLDLAIEMEQHEDILLMVNNQIYVDAVKESRILENEAKDLADELATLKKDVEALAKSEGEASEAYQAKAKELDEKQQAFDGKSARSKDLFTDAVFFANEAYHAEGPFKHIVEATQAVDSDVERAFIAKDGKEAWDKLGETEQGKLIDAERSKRRDGLTLHACLQSFNEQLGDFIKDLHHHAAAKDEDLPGTGFFRASKYLDRLIDAVDLLDRKVKGGIGVQLPGKVKTPKDVRAALAKGLLALRKGKIRIEKADASDKELAEQMEAYAIKQTQDLFGVSTLHDLGKMFKSYCSKVNAKLRAQVAAEMQALDNKAFFN